MLSLLCPRGLRLRGIAGAFGAFGSLLLHVVIFSAILYGGEGAPREHQRGVGATALTPDNLPAGVMILIDTPASTPHNGNDTDEVGSLGQLLQSPLLTIASPIASLPSFDFLDDSKSDSSQNDVTSGDQRGRAALFGLYMRQIRARIERVWQAPVTGTSPRDFACSVQVTQDSRGNVQEVQLVQCSTDPAWQISLVHAIERASPLPAPPTRAVFSNLLRLRFDYTSDKASPHSVQRPSSRIELNISTNSPLVRETGPSGAVDVSPVHVRQPRLDD